MFTSFAWQCYMTGYQPSWKQLGTVLAFTRYGRLTRNQLASRFLNQILSTVGAIRSMERVSNRFAYNLPIFLTVPKHVDK
jgi:hypothetical protein